METFENINNIISQVKKLDKEDQINLLQTLLQVVKKEVPKKSNLVKLSSLSGLGSEVWKYTDINSYIERERQW